MAVRKKLVSKDQMLDKSYIMIAIDWRARVVPPGKIQVDTPNYT